MGAIIFLAVAFGFFWAIEKNKDTGMGVVLLLAFTFFMGVMLSRLIGMTLGSYSNVLLSSWAPLVAQLQSSP